MDILDITSWEIQHIRPLNQEDIEHFAQIDEWPLREAVMLSLGYFPARQGERLPAETAKEIGRAVRDRWDLVERAMRSGKLEYTTRPYRLGSDTPEYIFKPSKFISWLISSGMECHEGISLAIKCKSPKSAQPDASEPEIGHGDKREMTQKERGSRKGHLIRDFESRIEQHALRQLDAGKKFDSHVEQADEILSLKKQDLSPLFPDPRPEDKRKTALRKHAIEGTRAAWISKDLPILGKSGVPRSRKESDQP